MVPNAIGVDIGGSHITAAIIDLENKCVLSESIKRSHVNAHDSVESVISEWGKVILEVVRSNARFSGKLGIAIPGPFDYKNGISLIQNQDKYDALYAQDVKKLLADKVDIPSENISFINDAAGFLKGEVFAGAARGYNRAIGITLGTGLGSAVYINGVAEDANWWNSPFNGGIAEDFLCTRWFVKRYAELSGEKVQNVKQLVEKFDKDQRVPQIFEEFGRTLGVFLALKVPEAQPEVIVIGGSISKSLNLFLIPLNRTLKEHDIHVDIQKAVLGEEAALLGATSFWSKF